MEHLLRLRGACDRRHHGARPGTRLCAGERRPVLSGRKIVLPGTDDSRRAERAGAANSVRQRLSRADYRARTRAQAQRCAPPCGVLDASHRLADGGVCDARRQGLGPVHLLSAARSGLDFLPGPRVGGGEHVAHLGGPAICAARMAQGSSGRASAAARLHVDRDLRDVGHRIGRPGRRGRGVPAAMVAGIAAGRRSDARSHAVLVHRPSDRVLLAAADLRFMVRADSQTGRRRAVQRHPDARGLLAFYPAGPGRLSSSVRRSRNIGETEIHRRERDLRDFLSQPDDRVLGDVRARRSEDAVAVGTGSSDGSSRFRGAILRSRPRYWR